MNDNMKIGEYNGRKYRAVAGDGACTGCAFDGCLPLDALGYCSGLFREYISFKRVKLIVNK